MHKQYVLVEAWIPDMSDGTPEHPIVLPPGEGGGPPGIWPSPGRPAHPIYWPPVVWPPPGRPAHPIAPGGPVPPVDPGYGVPGPPYPNPPGIWGGNDPYPTPPIYFPGGPVDPGYGVPGPPYPGIWPGGRPEHPIYYPPGIWGGSGEGFPTQPGPLPPTGIWPGPGYPAHPIAPGGPPPGIWPGGRPEHPIYYPPGIWGGNDPYPTPPINIGPEVPSYPVFDPDMLPQHPEVPDLNAGNWSRIEDRDGTTKWAFVPWPLAVTHPDYNPRYPPDEAQPGNWVVIVNYTTVPRYGAAWAWIPSAPSGGTTPPDGGGGGDQGENQPRAAKKA